MSYLFALLQKFASLFESPHLPMDSDYSYQARQQEAERIRKSRGTIMGIRLRAAGKTGWTVEKTEILSVCA